MGALPSGHLSQCSSKALEVSLQRLWGQLRSQALARMLSHIAVPSAKQESISQFSAIQSLRSGRINPDSCLIRAVCKWPLSPAQVLVPAGFESWGSTVTVSQASPRAKFFSQHSTAFLAQRTKYFHVPHKERFQSLKSNMAGLS